MEIYERIRFFRKELKFSQEKFGEELGVSGDVIKNIELNRVEIKPLLLNHICKIFNLSKEWLTTGQGDMYTETKQGFVERLAAEYGLNPYVQKILETYLGFDETRQEQFHEILKLFVDACSDGVPEDSAINEVASKLRLVDTRNATNETTATEERGNPVESVPSDRNHTKWNNDLAQEESATLDEDVLDNEYRAPWNNYLTEEEAVALVRQRFADANVSFLI